MVVLQKLLQNLKSIAISIAKFRKFCNKYRKILKVLQYLLQNFKSIAILCNTIGTTPNSSWLWSNDIVLITGTDLVWSFESFFIIKLFQSIFLLISC